MSDKKKPGDLPFCFGQEKLSVYPFSYASDVPSMANFLFMLCDHPPLPLAMTFPAEHTGFSYLLSNPHDEIPMEGAMFFFPLWCMLSLIDMAQKNYLKLAPMLHCYLFLFGVYIYTGLLF